MDGIPIEFVAKSRLQDKEFADKLDLILEEVQEGKILILEETLSPQEEGRLIQGAMERAGEEFPGIEFSTLEGHEDVFDKFLNNIYDVVGRNRRRGLTIVGNSDVMGEVEKQEDSVSLLATAEED
ncbi:MAG: DUF2073 domain-containing protein [Candidatus Nanohaloarchaeota archaeon QJJ-7]|nr:DUF2073 domain-containing protein [Candidatus Nanohaloarchaeota archaeon QJJ-7]